MCASSHRASGLLIWQMGFQQLACERSRPDLPLIREVRVCKNKVRKGQISLLSGIQPFLTIYLDLEAVLTHGNKVSYLQAQVWICNTLILTAGLKLQVTLIRSVLEARKEHGG